MDQSEGESQNGVNQAKDSQIEAQGTKPNPNSKNIKPVEKSWAGIVQGNKGADEGWKLDYVKPTGKENRVRITQEEWDIGTSSILE